MSIKSDIEELNNIDAEIKRYLTNINKLRGAKKACEQRVTSYLKEKDLPGVKHQDTIIRLDTKPKNVVRNKESRNSAIYGILLEAGVPNPNNLLEKITSASKDVKQQEKIRINKV